MNSAVLLFLLAGVFFTKAAKKPEIRPFHFTGDLSLGKRVTVACSVIDGDPPLEFSWMKDDHQVLSSGNIHIKTYEEDFLSNLIISKLDPESNGNYTCRVSNRAGKDEHSAVLLMKDAPKVSPFSFPSELDTGMRASVHCFVMHGNPPFEFQWFKDGQHIIEDRAMSVRKWMNMIQILSYRKLMLVAMETIHVKCPTQMALIKSLKKPEIRPFHFSGELVSGKRVILACYVMDGDPPFEFHWYKDGLKVATDGNVHTKTYAEDLISNLIISQLNSNSNGNYTCKVTNAAGNDEHSAVLLMKDSPEIGPFLFPKQLNAGMRASVICTVTIGNPPFEFTWFKDEAKVIETRGISLRKIDEFTSNLVISKVEAESNGNYTCKVSNSAGFDQKSAVLLVKDAPKISPFHFSGELDVGMRAIVVCGVLAGDPPFEFFWFKDGQKLLDTRGISIKFDEFASNLVISKVDAESIGNYSCKVSNSIGFDQKSAFLIVKDVPRIGPIHFAGDLGIGMRASVQCAVMTGDPPFEFTWFKNGQKLTLTRNGNHTRWNEKSDELNMKDAPQISPFLFPRELNSGMRASVQCAVMTGDPPFEFTWFKDGQKLTNIHGVSIGKFDDFTSNLVISKVDAGSNGNYTCKVSNNAGLDEKSAMLSVKDAPIIGPFHFSGELDVGMRATVVCAIMRGEPPFQFAWFKDGHQLNMHGVSILKIDDFSSSLVISKVEAGSNGNYTCKVSNSAGFDQKSALLSVKDVPKIGPFHFAGDLDVGMRASVQCTAVIGNPPFEFAWFKDGKKLMDTSSISIRYIDDIMSTLIISKVDANSNGNYSCKISNLEGADEKSAMLSVKDVLKGSNKLPVPSFTMFSNYIFMLLTIFAKEILGSKAPKTNPIRFSGELSMGLRTAIVCVVVDGDPPFDFRWLKNGIQMKETGELSIKVDEFSSMLTIKSLDAESNGNYTCRVSNSAGRDEKSDVLNIKVTNTSLILLNMETWLLLRILMIFIYAICFSTSSRVPQTKPFHFSGELKVGFTDWCYMHSS
ncbi:titin [Caerostris darwini]|uniref:Titin n=1 Tax=Caerostris darwini TaxID=1538125 RepID=A0AAV4R572_9ARAC|nr:titin [Caerostris darwini]